MTIVRRAIGFIFESISIFLFNNLESIFLIPITLIHVNMSITSCLYVSQNIKKLLGLG